MFGSKKRTREQEERAATEARVRARAEERAQWAQEKARRAAWWKDRSEVRTRFREAQMDHAQAKRVYDRYAPGPQKDAAAKRVNELADRLAVVEREFAAVDEFSAWERTH